MKKGSKILLFVLMMTLLCACGKQEAAGTGEEQTDTEIAEAVTESQEDTEIAGENVIPEQYAMTVVITINPQVRLFLDESQNIVGVEYMNEDAKDAFGNLELVGTSMEEGIGQVIEAAIDQQYLTEGKEVDLDVEEVRDESSYSDELCAELEQIVTQTVEPHEMEVVVTTETSAFAEDMESTEAAVIQNPCTSCNGTGKCAECAGDGYLGVGYTHVCPRCHGALTETCIYCDEAGNSNKHAGTCDFPNCMGQHVYPCTICSGGTKPVQCESCGGSGVCGTCGGTGEQP